MPETLTLQTETSRLLDLVVHSLYTERDVFLRELITNASDALDRLRVAALTRPELMPNDTLGVEITVDPAARTLTVADNGIGMSRAEVVNHIGTIARSGTQEFAAQLCQDRERNAAMALIGRFGVGFYSCFMVADRVTVTTRRAGEDGGTRWESSGDVHYTLDEAPEAPPGTTVTLHLKAADAESGREDYTDRFIVSRIVKRYADFVPYPIEFVCRRGAPDAEAQTPAPPSAPTLLNSMKPIWIRRPSEVKPDEYVEFYKHLTQDWNEPLLRVSLKAEGRWEYSALLFVPGRAPYDLYYHAASYGLQLYSARMLVVQNCQDLLPRYLRFVKGVVDAGDLPLNVSRQSLQDVHQLEGIRKWLAHKVIERLEELRTADGDKYLAFWREFGRAVKEGVSEDGKNRDRLARLLLFESSAGAGLTSLSEYATRMKPGQKEIFYVSGESRAIIERSPHVEALRARGYEVLYFSEPVDELAAQALLEYEGRPLRSAAKGEIEFDDDEEREAAARETSEQADRLSGLITALQKQLASRVRAVRVSRRLTVSPACLAGEPFDFSPHIEKLLKGSGARSQRTLELNPRHPVVVGLHERLVSDGDDSIVPAAADLLYGCALLAEGSELPEPGAFSEHVMQILSRALGAGAPQLV